MMGAEPFIRALEAGADVVLAGRASDTAIFASLPIMRGFPEGHGVACRKDTRMRRGGGGQPQDAGLHVRLGAQGPLRGRSARCRRCSARRKASPRTASTRTRDPFKLIECSGTLDLTNSRYEAASDRAVKVSGSEFIHAERYTVKLEGAEKASATRASCIGSIRDPFIIRQIDDWLARLTGAHPGAREDGLRRRGSSAEDYLFHIRVYGKNGTMGPLEPVKEIRSHELCLVFEVTAPTQEIASTIAGITRHQAHSPADTGVERPHHGLACPYSHLDRGAVYRFNVNHVVEPDDPYEMFPMELDRSRRYRQQRRIAA